MFCRKIQSSVNGTIYFSLRFECSSKKSFAYNIVSSKERGDLDSILKSVGILATWTICWKYPFFTAHQFFCYFVYPFYHFYDEAKKSFLSTVRGEHCWWFVWLWRYMKMYSTHICHFVLEKSLLALRVIAVVGIWVKSFQKSFCGSIIFLLEIKVSNINS